MSQQRKNVSGKATARTGPAVIKGLQPPPILTVNAGSSSIKFALFEAGTELRRTMSGNIDRIGRRGTQFTTHDSQGRQQISRGINTQNHGTAAEFLLNFLAAQKEFADVRAIGHRVVHGMGYAQPERVTATLLAKLHRIATYDPDHLPGEIQLIRSFREKHPRLPQVACFDTAFHHNMPMIAQVLPIPRRYAAKGLRRYGFHGLSYAFLMEELRRLGDGAAEKGRVILAHLGNGASLAAVRNGKSLDTSMGFTPAAGLMMSTRSGDLDPGVFNYLSRTQGMTAAHFENMVNHESGLLGVSARSSDVRDLLAKRGSDKHCALAIDMFCYQARKWIGSFAAALGGVDTLVFAGGIGENAPIIRQNICRDLAFLDIRINAAANTRNAEVISVPGAAVTVRVIHTDEELMIARSVVDLLNVKMQTKGK